jgi:hypothetical protein
MTVESLMTQSVTLLRPAESGRDDIGGVQTTETPTVVDGYLEPVMSTEVDQNSHPVGAWRLYVAAGTDVASVDRVTYGVHAFEVTGPPREMWNPRTEAVSHIELDLQEVL